MNGRPQEGPDARAASHLRSLRPVRPKVLPGRYPAAAMWVEKRPDVQAHEGFCRFYRYTEPQHR